MKISLGLVGIDKELTENSEPIQNATNSEVTYSQMNMTATPSFDPAKQRRYIPLIGTQNQSTMYDSYGNPVTVYFQTNTKNKSFIDMKKFLEARVIKDNKFHLILFDNDLANIDPHDVNLPLYMKQKVFIECQRNYYYYIREVVRIQSQGGPYVRYKLDRGNLALSYCFTHSLNIYHEQPRQTGKTVGSYTWFSWVYNFGSRNASMTFLNKKMKDAERNLDDMKKVIEALPPYLRFTQAFAANGQKLKGRNTVSYMRHPINFNKIETIPGAASETQAISLLRGRSITNCWIDESAFFLYLDKTLSNAMPALTRAFKNCHDNGAPHGLCLTSTPGFVSTDWGKYMYDLKSQMTPFSEMWYDLDTDQLTQLINSNEKSIFVHIRMTYQQLGYSEDWFKDRCKEQNYNWVDIRREYLLEWATDAENSPFTKEQLDIVSQLVRQPKRQIYLLNYLFNIYEELAPRVIPIIGADVAAGYNRDSSALSVIDSTTTKLVADFNCNYISTVDFARVIYELVNRYMPNALVCVERNGVGSGVVAKLMKSKIKSNLYYEIKERTIEEKSDGIHISRKKQMTKVYGLDNTKVVREQLMDLLMLRMEDHKDKFVSPIIANELKNLEVKKTGKIDHSVNSHDDAVFSYLLALYPIYYGKNIKENWNITTPTLKTEACEGEEIFQDFEGTETVGIADQIELLHNDMVTEQLKQINDGTKSYNQFIAEQRKENNEAMRQILLNKVGQKAYCSKFNVPAESIQEQNQSFSMLGAINNYYDESTYIDDEMLKDDDM